MMPALRNRDVSTKETGPHESDAPEPTAARGDDAMKRKQNRRGAPVAPLDMRTVETSSSDDEQVLAGSMRAFRDREIQAGRKGDTTVRRKIAKQFRNRLK